MRLAAAAAAATTTAALLAAGALANTPDARLPLLLPHISPVRQNAAGPRPLGLAIPASSLGRRASSSSSSSSSTTCPIGYATCDSSFCISMYSSCCGTGSGSSCPDGWDCTAGGGCCRAGWDCDDSAAPKGCVTDDAGDAKGSAECGGRCVPASAVCCGDDGTYCYAGQTCNSSGGCDGDAVGLGAGPDLALAQSGSDSDGDGEGDGDKGSGDKGGGDGGEDDAAVGVRANLALVGLVGALLVFF